ncbi:MAG: FtsW/RodA/SpoVE family cell cycle protein [Candidatus Dependentiae bacterium]|nr:FtsW/RodA/SpoVE family cell cycle protein [Candidatus Dependentiae bacterium]
MLINWRSLRYFDWISFALTSILACIGLLCIFSATYSPECHYSIYFKKQSIGLCIGILFYFIFALYDYRILMRWGYSIYIAIIALLLFTLLKGSIGMGAQRWINLFFFKVQPSELAKLFFPACIAHHFYVHKNNPPSFNLFMPILALLGISCPLIMKQPDLGTALIILFSGALLLWLGGIGKKFFIFVSLASLLLAPCFWHLLKDYQKKRITVFLGAGGAHKERYQIEQSIIAIGSGGLSGKGLLQGTQNKLHFLPEGRTDFIFAVLCEEFGLIGALSILMLYFLLMVRLLMTTLAIIDPYAQLLAVGLFIHILLSILINVGMVMNMLPVVGIPLPLISYGLSNLWITLTSLGWIQGIAIHERR